MNITTWAPEQPCPVFKFQLVFGKNRCVPCAKEWPSRLVQKVQKTFTVVIWESISGSDLHICEGTIDTQRYIGILKRHMLPSKQHLSLVSLWIFP